MGRACAPPATRLGPIRQRAGPGPASRLPLGSPGQSGDRACVRPGAVAAGVGPAPAPAARPGPLPAGAAGFGGHNSFAWSCSPVHRAGLPATPDGPPSPRAPPTSVLFFKSLHTLVHGRARRHQVSLLQRQGHVGVGQRLLGPPQLATQPDGFTHFISFSTRITLPYRPLPYCRTHRITVPLPVMLYLRCTS